MVRTWDVEGMQTTWGVLGQGLRVLRDLVEMGSSAVMMFGVWDGVREVCRGAVEPTVMRLVGGLGNGGGAGAGGGP